MKKLLAFLACALVGVSAAVAGEYEDISISDLKKEIEKGKVIIIDVNGSQSYAKGHIPGAIDYASKKGELEDLLKDKDKDTLVVAYCGGPSCSAYKSGAKAAEKLKFKNIKHLSAGISGWLQAGEKTEKAEKKDS